MLARLATMVALLALLCVGISATSTSQNPQVERQATATVIGIVDANTYVVTYERGNTDSKGNLLPPFISPYLIITPGLEQCYGLKAREFAEKTLLGKSVFLKHYEEIITLQPYPNDRQIPERRLLAYINFDDPDQTLFQKIMITEGMAILDARDLREAAYDITSLHAAMLNAQAARKGMWESCAKAVEPPQPYVFINEWESAPPYMFATDTWVELFNAKEEDQNIGGWKISGDETMDIPQGTIIGARQFLTFSIKLSNPYNTTVRIMLATQDGASMDSVESRNQSPYDLRCYARVPDGNYLPFRDVPFQTCSKGVSNGSLLYDPSAQP